MGVFFVGGLAILATTVYISIQKVLDYITCKQEIKLVIYKPDVKIPCLYGIQPFEIDYDDRIIPLGDSVLLFNYENDSENLI